MMLLAALVVALAWISLGIETVVFLGLADREKAASDLQSYVQKGSAIPEARKKGLGDLDTTRVAEDVRKELDSGLQWNAIVIGLGVVAALMALALPRYRALAVLGSSLVYWGFWYRFGFPSDVSVIDAYQLKWLTANTLNSRGIFFFKDIVLPLIFSASVVASFIALIWRKSNE